MRVVAIIPAGGLGKRAGGGAPKQFRTLGGRPLILRTLEAFEGCRTVGGIIVVVPKGMTPRARRILAGSSLRKVLAVCEGGKERQNSVGAGLRALPREAEIVVVHDAVRPFVSADLIGRVAAAAKRFGAAVAAVPVTDTVKVAKDSRIMGTLDRGVLWSAQTPQAFHAGILRRAYERAAESGFVGTDDAALVERMGLMVAIVRGDPMNLKITEPGDFALGEALISRGLVTGRRGPRRGTR